MKASATSACRLGSRDSTAFPFAERAAALTRTLFPERPGFVRANHREQWAAGFRPQLG